MAEATENARLGVDKGNCTKACRTVTEADADFILAVNKAWANLGGNLMAVMERTDSQAVSARAFYNILKIRDCVNLFTVDREDKITVFQGRNALGIHNRQVFLLQFNAKDTAANKKCGVLCPLIILTKEKLPESGANLNIL